jgi:hypothetical protein
MFGFNWNAAQVLLMGIVALTILSFYFAVAGFVVSRRVALVTTAIYGTSVFFVRQARWWTAGAHMIPATMFSLLTIGCYIRWARNGSHRWLVMSYTAFAVALLSHEQAMIVPAYLLLIRQLLLRPDSARPTILQEWRVWSVYGVLTALCALNFALFIYGHPGGHITPGAFLRFLGISLFQGYLPSAIGLPLPGAGIGSITTTVAISLLVIGAVVAATLWRSRLAWRSWAFFVGAFGIAVAPLGVGRTSLFGVESGREPLYQMAPAYLGLIALAAALDAPADRTVRWAPWPKLRRGAAVAAVPLALMVLARGADRVVDVTVEGNTPRMFFTTLRHEVAEARGRGERPVVGPAELPWGVVPGWLAPRNRSEWVFPLAVPALAVSDNGANYSVDETGHLVPLR